MTVDDRSRRALEHRLEEVLGEDHAMTLMGHLPRGELATKGDVDLLGARMVGFEQRIDSRMVGFEQRLEQRIDLKVEALEHRVIGSIHEAVGALRTELAAQTRTFFFSTVGAMLTLAAVIVTALGVR